VKHYAENVAYFQTENQTNAKLQITPGGGAENARLENAELENPAPNHRGGKRGTGKRGNLKVMESRRCRKCAT